MAQKFYTRLTQIGQAKYANAVGVGKQVEFVQLVVGDGGGQELTPEQVQQRETMVNQVRVGPINQVYKDADNPNWLVMEQVLPPDVGGWTIREVGVIDADGDLVAYGNYPATYKPVLEEGSSRTSTVRFVLMVSDTSVVTLKVDPSVVLATREYVDQHRLAHEQSRNHPAATEDAQGMVTFATGAEHREGDVSNRAATPAGVHAAFRQFGLGTAAVPDYNDDMDELKASGFYRAGGITANKPESGGSGYIIHINRTDGYAEQVYFGDGSPGTIYFRNKNNSSGWGQWIEIINEENISEFVSPIIKAYRSGDQFAAYDNERTYITGEICRGSDGRFYEFYDRDQVGTVQDIDPANVGNRPHIWMEWDGVKSGSTIEWRSETIPEGYIENDGAAISRSDYRRIFSVHGTTYGVGDGSSTFNLPDDRGQFKRGLDNSRGIDPSRNLGSDQAAYAGRNTFSVSVARLAADPAGPNVSNDISVNGVSIGWDSTEQKAVPTDAGDTRPRNISTIYITKI